MRKVAVLLVALISSISLLAALIALGEGSRPAANEQEDVPEIESCDGAGNTTDLFDFGAALYVKGNSLEPGGVYNLYIVDDYDSWVYSGTHISDLRIVEGPITVDVNSSGNIENQPVLIWDSIYVGEYDIWADSQTDGEVDFFDECDALDNLDVNDAGFSIIPEMNMLLLPIVAVCLIIIIMKRLNVGIRKRD